LLILVFVILEFTTRIASKCASLLQHYFLFIDPDKVFSWGIIHHSIQMLILLGIMLLWLPHKPLQEWGYRIGDFRKGIKWIFWFSLVWGGIYLILTITNIVLKNTPVSYYDVTNNRNLIGELSFRGLLVGLSEETLFRAFPITVLAVFWSRKLNIFRFRLSQAGIIAAVIFVYAHISYSFYPFIIHNIDYVQLMSAAVLGLLYAIVFEETQSILYPIIIHNISDVFPVLSLYILHIVNH